MNQLYKSIILILGITAIMFTQNQVQHLTRPSGPATHDIALSGISAGPRRVAHPGQRIQRRQPARSISREDESYQRKRQQVIDLVEDGAAHFMRAPFDQACHDFTRTKQFMVGELYLFLFDISGICYAHGNDYRLIWQNTLDLQDAFGTYFVREMIKRVSNGKNGNGTWITYEWRNAAKVSYIKKVTKNQKTYIIGSGYYPHSAQDTVVNLVKGAVALFYEELHAGHSTTEAFSAMSYPVGPFVYGNLYLYAADFDGVLVAQGNRPELIGTNVINYQDQNGLYLNREIINRVKQTTNGIWIEYVSANAPKRAYAEKVTDKQGKNYFIACGYYPDADRRATVDLVRRGYAFLKGHGLSAAEEEFTDKRNNNFRYGDLYLFVYDMNGVCLAHGGNESFVGQNQLNLTDQDGRLFVKAYIEKAQQGGGWVNAKVNNAFQTTYVERIDLGIEKYVIGCSLYPISREDSLQLLVNSAVDYLKTHDRTDAFAQFMKEKKGTFVRGDLDIFVIDPTGLCFVYDNDTNLIWRNIGSLKDDDGRPFVRDIINSSTRGSGNTRYRLNNAEKNIYSQRLEKDGKIYIVGSGYYD